MMKTAFWWLNAGLALMLFTSLLPVDIIRFVASASEGLWYARSEACLQTDVLVTLRWLRTFGDVVIIECALAVSWLAVRGLWFDRDQSEPMATVTEDSVCCGSCGGQDSQTPELSNSRSQS